jgi:hypothetical protein
VLRGIEVICWASTAEQMLALVLTLMLYREWKYSKYGMSTSRSPTRFLKVAENGKVEKLEFSSQKEMKSWNLCGQLM